MGRNRDVNDRIKKERRQKILAGALELFVVNGLAGTKISDIARHNGMSNGLIYHYFCSKEEIYTELVRTALDRMQEACKKLEKMELAAGQKIQYALDALIQSIRSRPEAGWYHLLITQSIAAGNIPKEAAEIIEEKRNIPHETITAIIRKGQEQGTVRAGAAEDLAFFFWVNINGIAQQQVMDGAAAKQPDKALLYNFFLIESEEENE